jgi:NAD(P)-dependent dehydrogenase (short-subunit alcohol dehydrogenase family)
MRSSEPSLEGRRVLITGAARGIGALIARRLSERGARVALLGLEPELLTAVAADCGDAPWYECDVTDRAVSAAVAALGGLDVVLANAGVAAQMPLVGGDARIFDATMAVNVTGTYNVIRAAGPHISHERGYVLVTSSLAAAVHLPLMSAYCASKAAVAALGHSLRHELLHTGARVGIAYYAELDTDMTSRGFSTKAASRMPLGGHGHMPVAPVGPAIDALERAIRRRSRRVVSPRWVGLVLHFSGLAVRVLALQTRGKLEKTLEIAREEEVELTTPQPGVRSADDRTPTAG